MARISPAACMAAAFLASGVTPALGEPIQELRIAPGQTIQQAMLAARMAHPGALHHGKTVAGASVDPTISAGAVLSQSIKVGVANSVPTLRFTYQAATNGLDGASFTFTSPNGAVSATYSYNPRTYQTGGTVTFSQDSHPPFYVQPGHWLLTSAIIIDNKFNYTQYSQAQLATLFPKPYVDVVNNGPVDITPPVVTAGKILTPKVSLSSSPFPTFKASLTGTDNLSGLAFGLVVIQPPGSTFGQVEIVPAPIPTTAGTVLSYANFFPGQPTGTWSITAYELCDVAGNCFTDTSATDITNLFGTNTFTVEK
jgi:hypothetical protein